MEKRNWTKVLLSVIAVTFIYCFNFNTLNVQAESQGTEEPIIQSTQLISGDLYLKFTKPNGSLYSEGTILNIVSNDDWYNKTYELNALSEVIIPNEELLNYEFRPWMTLKEGDNYNSPDFYKTFPSRMEVTAIPWMVSNYQRYNGDMEISVYKNYSESYLPGTKIIIEGQAEEYLLSENDTIIIPNSELLPFTQYVSVKVIEPGKAVSSESWTDLYPRR